MGTRRQRRAARSAAVERALARGRDVPLPRPAPSSFGHVRRPDGPAGLWLLARLLTRQRSANELYERIAREHGPLGHTVMAGEHVYVVSDPALVSEVFLGRSRDLMKGRGLQATRPLLGNGLLTSEGEYHLRQRRLAQPAFHRERIAEYATAMVSEAQRHTAGWEEGRAVDVVEEMTALTFAIVGRTLFGSDLTGDTALFRATLEDLMAGFSNLSMVGSERVVRALPRGRDLLARTQDLDVVVQRMLTEHRNRPTDDGRSDLLTWFIRSQDGDDRMTDAQLRDEVMTMVLAGHETTAMALSWSWWLLARHPEAARALRGELTRVLDGRAPTFDDLPQLPRTYATVAEAIRLYPPAWVIGRRSLVDLSVGGWDVPSGSILVTVPYAQHRDPHYWTEAAAFRPERWLRADGAYDESAPEVPRGSWIPFGFGNRRCIGEQFAWTEAVLVLATIASHWELRVDPAVEVRMQAGITLRPRGIPATLRRVGTADGQRLGAAQSVSQ